MNSLVLCVVDQVLCVYIGSQMHVCSFVFVWEVTGSRTRVCCYRALLQANDLRLWGVWYMLRTVLMCCWTELTRNLEARGWTRGHALLVFHQVVLQGDKKTWMRCLVQLCFTRKSTAQFHFIMNYVKCPILRRQPRANAWVNMRIWNNEIMRIMKNVLSRRTAIAESQLEMVISLPALARSNHGALNEGAEFSPWAQVSRMHDITWDPMKSALSWQWSSCPACQVT